MACVQFVQAGEEDEIGELSSDTEDVHPREEKARGDFTNLCKYLCKEDGAKLFPVARKEAMGKHSNTGGFL